MNNCRINAEQDVDLGLLKDRQGFDTSSCYSTVVDYQTVPIFSPQLTRRVFDKTFGTVEGDKYAAEQKPKREKRRENRQGVALIDGVQSARPPRSKERTWISTKHRNIEIEVRSIGAIPDLKYYGEDESGDPEASL